MAGEGGVVEATTNSNTEPLLPSNALYICSLSYFNNELRSFRSYLRWMCIDQFNVMHTFLSLWASSSPLPPTSSSPMLLPVMPMTRRWSSSLLPSSLVSSNFAS
ncbi:hypothetical protein GW17_00033861 [Ensete ventricosum]|nr:hypothetical protein GW17_00033861 [Ensete ventricosum]